MDLIFHVFFMAIIIIVQALIKLHFIEELQNHFGHFRLHFILVDHFKYLQLLELR